MDASRAERIKYVADYLASLGQKEGWEELKLMELRLEKEDWELLCDEFVQSLAERN